jgi:hypothetical protein
MLGVTLEVHRYTAEQYLTNVESLLQKIRIIGNSSDTIVSSCPNKFLSFSQMLIYILYI